MHVITVVKMLLSHEAQPSESTTNFDHCDDAHRSVDKSTDHAKLHSICFLLHNIKGNERNLCQDLLTIENTDLRPT